MEITKMKMTIIITIDHDHYDNDDDNNNNNYDDDDDGGAVVAAQQQSPDDGVTAPLGKQQLSGL